MFCFSRFFAIELLESKNSPQTLAFLLQPLWLFCEFFRICSGFATKPLPRLHDSSAAWLFKWDCGHGAMIRCRGSEVLQSVQGEFESAKAQMRRIPKLMKLEDHG